mmetsp:Transcript_85243/g.160562  ORF Transcript_85243/g.160562 Transcript_85243/m.160562 type:complete len:216 (+) Transcript_85243:1103-1750(+)
MKPSGIVEDARAIHDCDRLVLGEKNLVRSQIAIRPTSLEFGNCCFIFSKFSQQFCHVSVNSSSRHAICVMRNTTKLDTLACCQCLPIRIPTRLCKLCSGIHEARCVLIWPKEQELIVALQMTPINALVVWRLWQHAIQYSIQIPCEARTRGSWALRISPRKYVPTCGMWPVRVWQYDALRTALWNVLVLVLLRQCKIVTLLEQSGRIPLIGLRVP